MIVKIVGHRGYGASDAPFNVKRDLNMRVVRPVEGTLISHRKALEDGAYGIEMDVIETLDNYLVGTHADEVRQHVLVPYDAPEKYIGRMTYEQIRNIPVGPDGIGRISLLKDLLEMLKRDFPDRLINIELKGKLGNIEDNSQTTPSLAEKVVKVLEDVDFPFQKIIFSSFSQSYLQDMSKICSQRDHRAFRLGMLFEPSADCVGMSLASDGHKLFKDRDDLSIALNMETLRHVVESIPGLTSVHAEIRCITPDTMKFIREHNLCLATWALKELSPLDTSKEGQVFANAIDNVLRMADDVGLEELVIITDHILDVKDYLFKKHAIQGCYLYSTA
eukprot:gene8114-8953_t